MTESIRLAKRVADSVPCSRREAEQYIEGGWVRVDGEVIEEPGFRVAPGQKVELMPDATMTAVEPVTIVLHKPVGVDTGPASGLVAEGNAAWQFLTPGNRAADDRSPNRFLKRHVTGLTLTGPLETGASGLLVFTQDWRIVRKLIDDAARVEQEYIVEVSGNLAPDGLALLNHGLSFSGKALAPIKVSWQNETRLRFALKTPPRGLIEHMCGKVGLTVVAMKRIRTGRLPMAALAPGQWRYLLGYEQF
ncbi:MAG: rRNA pseudouridine synthase [Pseudomonadota bacterium]